MTLFGSRLVAPTYAYLISSVVLVHRVSRERRSAWSGPLMVADVWLVGPTVRAAPGRSWAVAVCVCVEYIIYSYLTVCISTKPGARTSAARCARPVHGSHDTKHSRETARAQTATHMCRWVACNLWSPIPSVSLYPLVGRLTSRYSSQWLVDNTSLLQRASMAPG